jgi:hypothetical protein
VNDPGQLTLEDFRTSKTHVKEREKTLKDKLTLAEKLYSGQQHVRLMRGVELLRSKKDQVDLGFQILSAGYGLIPANRKIAPYETTFQGMKKTELRDWAAQLSIPKDFQRVISEKRNLNLILLGDSYLEACGITDEQGFVSPTLLFCGKGTAKKIKPRPNLRVVTLSNPEAKRFSCGLVGLKGEIAHRICVGLASGKLTAKKLTNAKTDVLSLLDGVKLKEPKSKKKSAARSNPKVDKVIKIPQSWWDKKHRSKLCYFIPEWDDLVDPDYDFIKDDHSGGTGDWSNEVYAHQMYPTPNYDGILVSRVVAEKSKKKKERINEMGVHRYLRVPREYPIMGDCGAFDYIMEDVPPFTIDDVLNYYTRLDFDYGVSLDHLIVKATEHVKDFRYKLTIDNANEFIKEHRKAKLKWEPIGAVQGWDPASYAKAAAKYVKMGYRYIGLGGLVRTSSKKILATVEAVRTKIPDSIKVHVFGIARLDAMNRFEKAGVNSVDSASHLRQAWMRLHESFASMDGPYAALRIPQAGKSFRAKHMLEHPDLSDDKIISLEQSALNAVRGFGAHKVSLDNALNALLNYDRFVTKERESMEDAYRRTLEDRPWDKCECAICKSHGIEVVIFRGNNRNRRRGFHNTYVFYHVLQDVLNTGQMPDGFLTGKNKGQLELFATSGN